MRVSYTQKELVDSQKIVVLHEHDKDFWRHHGREPEEKENLRHYARILPQAIDKVKNEVPLSEDEKYSYDIFIINGPVLNYDSIEDVYTITDGRHRMCMLRDENINIIATVSHLVNFRGKTDIETFHEEENIENNKSEDIIQNNEENKSKFLKLFSKIFHINKELNNNHKDIKYSNVIDFVAIQNNEITKKMLQELGVQFKETFFDDYLLVNSDNTNLEDLIKNFSNEKVLVSTESIRKTER